LIQLITDTLAALVGAQTVVVVGVARYQMGEKKEEEGEGNKKEGGSWREQCHI
jgi:hypothetical protein